MANTCPVCGGKLGLLNREKSADGLICASCSNFFYSKLGFRAAKQPTAALADYWATLPTGCFVLGTAAVIKALARSTALMKSPVTNLTRQTI